MFRKIVRTEMSDVAPPPLLSKEERRVHPGSDAAVAWALWIRALSLAAHSRGPCGTSSISLFHLRPTCLCLLLYFSRCTVHNNFLFS